MTSETDDLKFRRVIEKAWSDEKFKERLRTNPASVLQQYGIEAPDGKEIELVESNSSNVYFILPPAPGPELSESEKVTKSESSDYKVLVHVFYNVNCC